MTQELLKLLRSRLSEFFEGAIAQRFHSYYKLFNFYFQVVVTETSTLSRHPQPRQQGLHSQQSMTLQRQGVAHPQYERGVQQQTNQQYREGYLQNVSTQKSVHFDSPAMKKVNSRFICIKNKTKSKTKKRMMRYWLNIWLWLARRKRELMSLLVTAFFSS